MTSETKTQAEEIVHAILIEICDGTYNTSPRDYRFIDRKVGDYYERMVEVVNEYLAILPGKDWPLEPK